MPFKIKAFGYVSSVPEVTRTPDLPLRRRVLYPAELRGLERYEVYEKSFFTSTDFDDRDIRRRSLYPSELRKRV